MTSASVIFSNSLFFKLDLVLFTLAIPGATADAMSLTSDFEILAFDLLIFVLALAAVAEMAVDVLDVDGSIVGSTFLSLIEYRDAVEVTLVTLTTELVGETFSSIVASCLVDLLLPLVILVLGVATTAEAIVLSETQLDAVGLGDLVTFRVLFVRVVFLVMATSSSISAAEFCSFRKASIFSNAALCFFKLLIDILGGSEAEEASSLKSSSFLVVLADRVLATVALAGFSISTTSSSAGSIKALSLLRVTRTSFSLEPNVEGICCRLALSLATASMLAVDAEELLDEVELRSLFLRRSVALPGLESMASSVAFLMLSSLSSMCRCGSLFRVEG